jgi:hypothetical protein
MREPRAIALLYIAIAIFFIASAIWISTRIEQRIICAFAAVMFCGPVVWNWCHALRRGRDDT